MRLATIEIEALLAAAGNADPAMWEDYPDEKQGDKLSSAWQSGMEKLAIELTRRESKRKVKP